MEVRSLDLQLFSLRSLFISVGSIQLASAALGTLVALKIAHEGGSQSEVSLVAASYSMGFLLGCFFIFRPLSRIGHVRAFAAGAALCSLFTLLIAQTESTLVLTVARFVTGLATAGLFAIGDSWINDTAVPAMRGRILSIYYVILGVSSVMSQTFIVFYEGETTNTFVIMATLYNIAIVVLAATRTTPPKLADKANLRIRGAFKEARISVVGAFTNGFILALILYVVPYEASVGGLDPQTIALLIGGFYIGRVLLQVPLGRASDRGDRRIVIVAASLATSALLFVLAYLGQGEGFAVRGDAGIGAQIIAVCGCILLGGTIMPLYSLLVAHAMDRTVPVYVSSTAVTLLFIYTVGSVAGPLVASVVAIGFGNDAIFWLSFGLMVATTIYSAAQIPRTERTPIAEMAVSVATTQTSVAMTQKEKRPV